MTTGVNSGLTEIEDLFQTLVWNNLVDVGVATLFSAVPILSIWPLSSIITGTLHAISNWFYGQFRLVIDMEAIAYVNAAHKVAFDQAAVKLQIVLQESGANSPQYQEARDAAKQALATFVHFTGT